MSIKKLKLRWDELDFSPVKLLEDKIDLRTVLEKFPKIDNLYDFRGVDLKEIFIKDSFFCDIDFSFSDFSGAHFENCVFRNCNFKKVSFNRFIDGGNAFEESCFENCNFSNAALGYNGSKFCNVYFIKPNFKKTLFIRPEFVHTSFENSVLLNIDFNASSFTNCLFEGSLENCWFRGSFPKDDDLKRYGVPKRNEMLNVSFKKAVFKMVDFSQNCDLSTVIPPLGANYRKYDFWNDRLEFLNIEKSKWNGELRREADIFYNIYSRFSKNQNWFIINIVDIANIGKSDIAQKIASTLDNYK